jgi:type VI secretion system protein ImpH
MMKQHVSSPKNEGVPLAAPDQLEQWCREPWRYGFFALLRRIGANPQLDPIGTARRPSAEPFRLGQQPSLRFAPREIASMGEADQRLKIRVFGLGMLGPNGPLPTHVTEIAREREEGGRDATLSDFLDIFHHRYLTLLYRAWACAQAAAGLDRSDHERFSFYIACLTGDNLAALRGRPLPAHAYLSAAAHRLREARNPDGLRATLAHFFGVPVRIDEYAFHWVDIDPCDRCLLALAGAASLAQGAILGTEIPDRQHRFRIVVGPVRFDEYLRFTPRGADLLRLVEWVRAFVGYEFAWELELRIEAGGAPCAVIGGPQQLGWSGWIGTPPAGQPVVGMCFEPERQLPVADSPRSGGRQ